MPTSTRMIPPDRVPCIASPKDDHTPKMNNQKLLLPDDLTCQQLIQVIRSRIRMKPNEAVFVFCENRVLSGCTTVRDLLHTQSEQGGILYVVYSLENTFG